MKGKELAEEAEEYAREWLYHVKDLELHHKEDDKPEYIRIKEAFLAGLKAGRPKWHDLRKDPKDLPKDNDEKLCFYGEGKVVARYDREYGCWETRFNNLETVIPLSVIIAWCETSVFGQE